MSDGLPGTLLYFEAFKEDGSIIYLGVIAPGRHPMTQREYDRQAKKNLDHYRRLPFVVKLRIVELHASGTREEERKGKRMVETRRDLVMDDYMSNGGR